jgi:hypothetical protein
MPHGVDRDNFTFLFIDKDGTNCLCIFHVTNDMAIVYAAVNG